MKTMTGIPRPRIAPQQQVPPGTPMRPPTIEESLQQEQLTVFQLMMSVLPALLKHAPYSPPNTSLAATAYELVCAVEAQATAHLTRRLDELNARRDQETRKVPVTSAVGDRTVVNLPGYAVRKLNELSARGHTDLTEMLTDFLQNYQETVVPAQAASDSGPDDDDEEDDDEEDDDDDDEEDEGA